MCLQNKNKYEQRNNYRSISISGIRIVTSIIILLQATSTICQSKPDAMEANHELQVQEGNQHFTKKLYEILSKDEGNLIFSPISVHAVLSMAFQGAGGTTKDAFAGVLKFADQNSAASGYNQVMGRLNAIENVTLHIANKVFVKSGLNLMASFQNAVVKSFLSEVESMNFADNVKSAKTINQWVEQKTNEKIKDLISPDLLDDLTRIVLVNAIYFKGNWLNKFDPALTTTEPFYVTPEKPVDVQMMHLKRKFQFKHVAELQAKVLELPYTNKDVSMVVILPDAKDGISALETKLADFDLSTLLTSMHNVEVAVSLPRFKIEKTIELEDSLIKLGLGVIFDKNEANFSGIIDNPEQLYVSKVIQKAFIEVNEEGAEAAAATGMILGLRCAMIPALPQEFVADHPFVFKLITKKGREVIDILFGGRISQFK